MILLDDDHISEGSVEDAVERVFREKVASMPYSSLSVVQLCKGAAISRKAFYRCFRGKNDVLRHVFDRDVVAPQVELCRLLSFEKMSAYALKMESRMFAAVYADADFYHNVVNAKHGGEEAFTQEATSAFDKFSRIMLQEYNFAGSSTEVAYVASFFSEGKARYMARWIRDGFALSVDEAAHLYARMALPFWKASLAKLPLPGAGQFRIEQETVWPTNGHELQARTVKQSVPMRPRNEESWKLFADLFAHTMI